jgi:hypothetical protein
MNKRYYGGMQANEERNGSGGKSLNATNEQDGVQDKKSIIEVMEYRPSIDSSVNNDINEAIWSNIERATDGLENLESFRFISSKRKEADSSTRLGKLADQLNEFKAAREVASVVSQDVESKLIDGIEAILEVTKSELLDNLDVPSCH